MKITIVSYKPESADYCRGCLMEQYSADLSITTHETVMSASEQMGKLQAIERGFGEIGYEHTIILSASSGELGLSEEEEEDVKEEIKFNAKNICQKIILEREEKKRLQVAAEKEREIQLQRERDLKAFEALKEKLGK